MLGEQFYVKSEKIYVPVIVILFCKFSMQYMCLWRYDIFFKSVYFWVFLSRNAFLGGIGRERHFKLLYWWTLGFHMELSSEWRYDAWRTILMWNLEKNYVPCHIHPFLAGFQCNTCVCEDMTSFSNLSTFECFWVEMRF